MVPRRNPSALAVLVTALLLGGCFPRPDYSGIPSARDIRVSVQSERVALDRPPAAIDDRRETLSGFLAKIPQGASVRYHVLLPPDEQAAPYLSWAKALGAEPTRTSVVRQAEGTPPQLEASAATANPPSCETMLLSPSQVRHERRATFAFGCATLGNLTAMIDDPADLVAPSAFGGASATREAKAVRRYLDDDTKPLNDSTTLKSN